MKLQRCPPRAGRHEPAERATGFVVSAACCPFVEPASFEVVGEPVSLAGAEHLAAEDPYQFQWWVLGLVGARPVEQRKGADKGIDGRLYFHEGGKGTDTKQIILSVKAGKPTVAHLRDLRGVVDREGAQLGVLLLMHKPTKPMVTEAATAGFYTSPWGQHPRLQILTAAELMGGTGIDYPNPLYSNVTLRKAPKVEKPAGVQLPLLGDD